MNEAQSREEPIPSPVPQIPVDQTPMEQTPVVEVEWKEEKWDEEEEYDDDKEEEESVYSDQGGNTFSSRDFRERDQRVHIFLSSFVSGLPI